MYVTEDLYILQLKELFYTYLIPNRRYFFAS